MEDKNQNESPKPEKSIWKKSNFKREDGKKCKKNIRFNLNVNVHYDDEDHISSSKQDGKPGLSEPSPKKRKKENTNIPSISNEVEREIECQYRSKAKESKLTARNVKTILKSVITNKYVVDMVRAAEEGGQSAFPFEPKLTRAKTKELLQHPEVPVPPVMELLSNSPTGELSPEIKLLIDEELSEDSSDEEYNPENEPEPPSEDEDKGDVSVASDMDSLPPTPVSSQAPPTPVHECSYDLSQDGLFKVPQENVGQRTRSKLDFHDMPLECIEQAYVPPDITPDMYEAECDNPDWHDFLKEFTQPLAANETLEDDPDNDPEYNIFEDEEKDPIDYKEEMRKDKAVKVSKKELNSLMKELFEMDALSSDDEGRTSESIAELEASIMKETEERQRREAEEKKKKQLGFHPNQLLLLSQQMRQHVQLTTQHYLQTYHHPRYYRYAATFKTMLVTLSGLKQDKVCGQETFNLSAALDTVAKWESIVEQSGDKIRQFVLDQIEAEAKKKKSNMKMSQDFPPELMKCMMESEAILYPLLLPSTPFLTCLIPTGHTSFTASENMLLALCLEQVTQMMDRKKRSRKKRTIKDMAQVIYDMTIPRSAPSRVAYYIRKMNAFKQMNPIKAFFRCGKAPTVVHYVYPVYQGLKLYQQPPQLMPQVWRKYLAEDYWNKVGEYSNEIKPSTSKTIQDQPDSELGEKNKEVDKQQEAKPSTSRQIQEQPKCGLGEKKKEAPQQQEAKPSTSRQIQEQPKSGLVEKKKEASQQQEAKPSTSRQIQEQPKCGLGEKKKEDYKQQESKPSTSRQIQEQQKSGLGEKKKEASQQQRKDKVTIQEQNKRNILGKAMTKHAEENVKISDKEIANLKRITITNIIQNANAVNQLSRNCDKPKTTQRDIRMMLDRKSSIEHAVFNGKINLYSDQLHEKEAYNSDKLNMKTRSKNPSTVSVSKLKNKQETRSSPNKRPGLRSSNSRSIGKTGNNKPKKVSPKKISQKNLPPKKVYPKKKSKTKTLSKRRYKDSVPIDDFIETVVPKMNFKVVSKCSYIKSKIEEDKTRQKSKIESDKRQYLKNVGLTHEKIVRNNLSKPNTLSSELSNHFDPGFRLHSESDSHQSNSIECERTPLFVNTLKPCSSVESHSPKPPSTVKLKNKLNCDSLFGLCSDKTKVPSTAYSLLNGSS